MNLKKWLNACVDYFMGKYKYSKNMQQNQHTILEENEAKIMLSTWGETICPSNQLAIIKYIEHAINSCDSPTGLPIIRLTDQPKPIISDLQLPNWLQGEIPTELFRLARVNCEEPLYRQILADWMERYGGEEGRLLCRFFRRDAVLSHDASTWQTLSASEARLVAPFSDLALGIGDRVVLPLTETQTITMSWVPSGDSWLGGGGGTEGTVPFSLKKGLWCGIYPITQEQWQAVMGDNPSRFKVNSLNPVEMVTYNDVQDFLQKVNAANSISGFSYHLPSASEWEYILRGGPIPKSQSQYSYYFARSKTDLTAVGSNELFSNQANFDLALLNATSPVGNFLPNPLGIYDMHGNVWEWTSTKAIREWAFPIVDDEKPESLFCGGGWDCSGKDCMASNRSRFSPYICHINLGFRLLAIPVVK